MQTPGTDLPSVVLVQRDALRQFADQLLLRAGAPPEHASVVTNHLIEADTMGLPSHGIMRIPQYLEEIALGGIVPGAVPAIDIRRPGRAMADGGRGFGQVVGQFMANEASKIASVAGVAFVTGRHMGHTGRIGAYAESIAQQGGIGIVVCSGPRSGHFVAPFGGREGRLATNPIAFACPVAGRPAIAADFSTSVAPEGVIRNLRNKGLSAPLGSLRDASGVPTTDPWALYDSPRGSLQPLGGDVGYRGTALAILVEILAALLAGDDTDDDERQGSNLAMIAIAADSDFAERACKMADYIASSHPIEAAARVLLPGEREQQQMTRQSARAIAVDRSSWEAMIVHAGSYIDVPKILTD
jgi:hydroxycarboxylate dehydrogenase B